MSWLPDWITGYDSANAQRAAAADAELRTLNTQRAQTLGEEWAALVEQDYARQEPIDEASQRAAIDQAFNQGIEEGRSNITSFITGAFNFVGKTLAAVIAGIPLWVWLLAGVGLWIYLGAPGLRKLKGKFA